MKNTELLAIKESLLSQRNCILNKTHEFKKEQSDQVIVCEEVDIITKDMSNNISIQLFERDLNVLVQIEKALGKIDEGTYGHCDSCGSDINWKRLMARPFATFCIDCMEEYEDSTLSLQ